MKNKFKYFLFFVFFVLFKIGIAFADTVSELQQRISADKEDTVKVNHLNDLAWELMYTKSDTSVVLAEQALVLSEKLGWTLGVANSQRQLGNCYDLRSEYIKALDFFYKALRNYEALRNTSGIMKSFRSIGIVYSEQANYSKALDFYLKALKLSDQVNDIKFSAYIQVSIGNIFYKQKEYQKALDYYFKALSTLEKQREKRSCMNVYANIGVINRQLAHYITAEEYSGKALELAKEFDDKYLVSDFMINLAIIKAAQKEYTQALQFLSEALAIKRLINDLEGVALCLSNIGTIQLKTGKIKDAELQFLQAAAIDYTAGSLDYLLSDKKNLAWLYDSIGKFRAATRYYKEALRLNDSIYTIEKKRDLTRQEVTYEFEKKEIETKAEFDKQIALKEEEKKQQRIVIWFVLLGLLLVFVFAIFIYNRFRVTQKQKQIIEHQKHLVEEKSREIFDSISYAKRLQKAILPSDTFLKELLPESFVVYLPKDIVAGDFYWIEQTKDHERVFFAVADCTGHGVPGAMVSMIGNNALNRSVKGYNLIKPSDILDRLCRLVDKTFARSESEVQDGMDISLCSFNTQTRSLDWAGANNPLLLIRDGVLHEYQPDKQPIGKFDYRKPFTNHSIQIKPGDVVYLFSDGYADQFGGAEGKKFKYRQFKALLLNLSTMGMDEQRELLILSFDKWKVGYDQTDDVCVMGVRF